MRRRRGDQRAARAGRPVAGRPVREVLAPAARPARARSSGVVDVTEARRSSRDRRLAAPARRRPRPADPARRCRRRASEAPPCVLGGRRTGAWWRTWRHRSAPARSCTSLSPAVPGPDWSEFRSGALHWPSWIWVRAHGALFSAPRRRATPPAGQGQGEGEGGRRRWRRSGEVGACEARECAPRDHLTVAASRHEQRDALDVVRHREQVEGPQRARARSRARRRSRRRGPARRGRRRRRPPRAGCAPRPARRRPAWRPRAAGRARRGRRLRRATPAEHGRDVAGERPRRPGQLSARERRGARVALDGDDPTRRRRPPRRGSGRTARRRRRGRGRTRRAAGARASSTAATSASGAPGCTCQNPPSATSKSTPRTTWLGPGGASRRHSSIAHDLVRAVLAHAACAPSGSST